MLGSWKRMRYWMTPLLRDKGFKFTKYDEEEKIYYCEPKQGILLEHVIQLDENFILKTRTITIKTHIL